MQDDQVVTIEITDELDLHLFQPGEVKILLDEYVKISQDKGFRQVRIIHGKGRGVLRARVHSLLRRHPQIAAFHTAPESAGGWGATVAVLKQP